jgi:hypothetical protein
VRTGSVIHESPTKTGGAFGLGGAAAEREQREREAREREREQKERERDGPSAALLDKVRALDALPRVGALRTLDLRGNDLRVRFFLRLFLFYAFFARGFYFVGRGDDEFDAYFFADGHHVHCASPEAESDPHGSQPRGEQTRRCVFGEPCRGAGVFISLPYPFAY